MLYNAARNLMECTGSCVGFAGGDKLLEVNQSQDASARQDDRSKLTGNNLPQGINQGRSHRPGTLSSSPSSLTFWLPDVAFAAVHPGYWSLPKRHRLFPMTTTSQRNPPFNDTLRAACATGKGKKTVRSLSDTEHYYLPSSFILSIPS